MEKLEANVILKYQPDVLNAVRNGIGLGRPNEMSRAVDIFEEWIKQQNHFTKQDFPRDFLERLILTSKGSVERAKNKLDKICTFRTLLPQFFGNSDYAKDFNEIHEVLYQAVLPEQTKDYSRIYIDKIFGNLGNLEPGVTLKYYKALFMMGEYCRKYDYSESFIAILDYRDTNLMDLKNVCNIFECQQAATILIDAYGHKIKGIHIISPSKLIMMIVMIFKQILSAKVGNRIQVHKSIDTLYEFVPKEILPVEYGGEARSLKTLHDEWAKELSTDKFKAYMSEMNKACTDESLRQKDLFNEQYMGIAGTFRTLSVD